MLLGDVLPWGFVPPVATTVQATGIPEAFLRELVLLTVWAHDVPSLGQISQGDGPARASGRGPRQGATAAVYRLSTEMSTRTLSLGQLRWVATTWIDGFAYASADDVLAAVSATVI